jgi:hypothetical protein
MKSNLGLTDRLFRENSVKLSIFHGVLVLRSIPTHTQPVAYLYATYNPPNCKLHYNEVHYAKLFQTQAPPCPLELIHIENDYDAVPGGGVGERRGATTARCNR